MAPVVVVSSTTADELKFDSNGKPIIPQGEAQADALDDFNHPRLRKAYILKAFSTKYQDNTTFVKPSNGPIQDLNSKYKATHSDGLITFLVNAWNKWVQLGDARDPMSTLKTQGAQAVAIPPLVPGNVALPRESRQRPSQNVMGQIGYYSTDLCTPVFASLLEELQWDASILEHALELVEKEQTNKVIYALPTHPGHHGAFGSFGGYCYINQAAHAAMTLQQKYGKAAVLDVDYHVGNGTASIFYDNPNVLVISIHCHPDWDYPFHSGFEDENETAKATYHLPLLPGATWESSYKEAVEKAMKRIREFGAKALVVSLGLDTLDGDPVTLRRAGFRLKGNDYVEMGKLIGSKLDSSVPCMFVQEGGYKMEELGMAAADVVSSFASVRKVS
jgi:acetoin utilization deacetylase AcuC-like enzyme